MQQTNIESHQKMLNHSRDQIDLTLANIKNAANYTNLLKDVTFFAKNHYLSDPHRFNRMRDNIDAVLLLNNDIAFVTVVFYEFEFFLYSGSSLNNSIWELSDTSFIKFSQPYANEFLTKLDQSRQEHPLFTANDKQNYIILNMPILSSSMKEIGVTYFAVSADTIMNLMDNNISSNPYYYDIRDKNNNILISKGSNPEGSIKGINTYSVLSKYDWTFHTIYPLSSFMKGVRLMRNLLFLIILIFLVVILTSSFYFSRRFYYPIEAIMVDNHKMELFLEKYRPSMKATFLNRLIRGVWESHAEVNELLDYYQLDFSSPFFTCLVVQIKFNQEDTDRDRVEQIISEEINRLLNEQDLRGAAFINPNREITIVINHDKELAVTTVVDSILNKIRNSLKRQFRCSITAGCGLSVNSAEKLNLSWQQARQALSYSFVNGSDHFFEFKEANDRTEEIFINFNVVRLANSILSCDRERTKEELSSFPPRNLAGNPDNIRSQILFHMVNLIEEINIDEIRREFMDHNNLKSLLFETQNLEDIRLWISSLADTLINRVEDLKEQGNKQKNIKDMIEFIESEYQRDISLADISASVSLNPNYATTLFTNSMGVSLIEYLNHYRIEKCKELLLSGNNSLSVIAKRVGYNNPQSLVRYFKKYEGLSPTSWKENRL